MAGYFKGQIGIKGKITYAILVIETYRLERGNDYTECELLRKITKQLEDIYTILPQATESHLCTSVLVAPPL